MSSSSSLSSMAHANADAPSSCSDLPKNQIVVGCGAVSIDYLATVAKYPRPDDKIRSLNLKVQGGGNVGNALTCAACLGLTPRVISKVANDAHGRSVLEELEADGVDISYILVSEEGNTKFTYVILDNQMKTHTCIYTPAHPPMAPDEISQSKLSCALDGAKLIYFDGTLIRTALVVANEAARMQIPILVDAERNKDGLDDLLSLADYVVCSSNFPLDWTMAPSIPSALVSILLRLPQAKFVIVTLGENGCMMLQREVNEGPQSEETDIESLLETLKQRIIDKGVFPMCISSKPMMKLRAVGIGAVSGRLFVGTVGTAEKIPPSELVDTTGAGDAFIGAIIYGMVPEKMLPFAARVAAAGCRALGARTGLPRQTDPWSTPFLC